MEERENFGAVNAVAGNQVAVSFHGAPRIENNLDFSMATVPVSMPVTAVKKKRGRPRKYGPDGKPTPGSATALSPMPISSSIPLTGEFSAWKRGGGKPVESIKKSSFKFDFESPPGQGIIYSFLIFLVSSLKYFEAFNFSKFVFINFCFFDCYLCF